MCGIIGFVGQVPEGLWGQTHDLLRELLLSAEHRGHDATGFVAQTKPLDYPAVGQVVLSKQPMKASHFVEKDSVFRRLRHKCCALLLGHVRAATSGSPGDNRNNHPFVGEDGLYLVHNGVVANDRELADKYALHLESECDSEVLLRLVETAENPVLGLSLLLREVEGSFAVALYDQRRGVVWLCRNEGRPLWLARLERDRRWFIASTAPILLEALGKVLGKGNVQLDYLAPIPEGTPMALSPAGMVIAPLTLMMSR